MITKPKTPPQALDLESAVLGAILLEKDALSRVSDTLSPKVFYKLANGLIYKAAIQVSANNDPVDMLTVMQQLVKNKDITNAGGASYISQLTNTVASAQSIEVHAKIIVEKSIKRDIILLSSQLTASAYEDATDIFDLIGNIEQGLNELTKPLSVGKVDKMDGLWEQLQDKNNTLLENKGVSGVPSGYDEIDSITGGWQSPDLIIIAARPAMGKTSLVANFARNAAVESGAGGCIFSLEMSALQIATRIFSLESEVGISDFLRKGISKEQMLTVGNDCTQLIDSDIYIDDTPSLSISSFKTKARKLKREKDIKWIAIDYIQLMTIGGDFRGNREQEISTISRSLKAVAKELEIPIMALSQLSRAVESRGGDKRPQLSDLRDSGAIEQDADMVIFLHRPEYYGIMEYEDGSSTEGTAEIIFSKHRNGATGTANLGFVKRLTKFTGQKEQHTAKSLNPSTDFFDQTCSPF